MDINSIIYNNKNYAIEYLTEVQNANPSQITQKYINNYNEFINAFTTLENCLKSYLSSLHMPPRRREKGLYYRLKYKYESTYNIIYKINSIKTNNLFNQNKEKFSLFIEHLAKINMFNERFSKYFSNNDFINNYSSIIKNFIQSKLTEIKANLNSLFLPTRLILMSNSLVYDYYKFEIYTYSCCKRPDSVDCCQRLYDKNYKGFLCNIDEDIYLRDELKQYMYVPCNMPQSTDCWIRTLCNETKFVGYVVNSSINNNKKLLYFNFDIYWNNFNKLYADINSNIYSDISSYIKILNKIEKEFNSLLNGHNEEYLNGIQSLIQSIKDNMLENKLLEVL